MMRKLVVVIAAFAAGGCADRDVVAPDLHAPAQTSLSVEPTEGAVVVFASEGAVPEAGLDLIAALGGAVSSRHDAIGVVFATGLSASALETLRQSEIVEDAGPDYELNWLPDLVVGDVVAYEGDLEPNTHDPASASQFRKWQWGPQRVAADRAWEAGYVGSPNIRVAILDTGIDFLHTELRDLVDIESSASFVETEPSFDDYHFHGTHVASTVSTNSVAIAGVAPHVTLIAVKVLSALGSGTFEGVIGGIMHAANVDAHIINMSLGAQFDRRLDGAKALIRALQRSIQYAQKQGTIVISAAGNSSTNLDDAGSPIVAVPCMVSTICVSATGPLNGAFDANGPVLSENHDQPAYYTNYGVSAIHVAAPGGNANPADPDQSQGTWRNQDLIIGACAGRSLTRPYCAVNDVRGTVYIYAGGTSMAAPHVSGAAAMIQAAFGGSLGVEEVYDRLTGSADDVGEPGSDPYSNFGRINVYRAITGQ